MEDKILFKKSSFSDRRDRCVEVAIESNCIKVKHSKMINPILVFTYDEWEAFLLGVKNNEFDLHEKV